MNKELLIGFYLDKAKDIIINEGLELGDVVFTAPPRERPLSFENRLRVVRVELSLDGKVNLLVCRDMRTNHGCVIKVIKKLSAGTQRQNGG
jgi:hypothetical protein